MGAVILSLIIISIYLFLSHKVALKAESNGSGYKKWFLIAMVIDPILAYVLVLMLTSEE